MVDDSGIPKDGKASACVARQYSGTLGKVANCQIAVTVHAATDTASAVLNWRLAGYGQVAEFRQGLTERGIAYIVATTSSTTAQPGDAQPVQVPYAGVGPHPTPRYPHPARSLKHLALTHGADATTLVRWRARLPTPDRDPDQPAGELSGHFFALRVRPAGRAVRRGPHRGDDGVLPECWLLVQWPPGQDEPSDYWLSDL
ncbi:transposase, partial [Salinispora mooreana]